MSDSRVPALPPSGVDGGTGHGKEDRDSWASAGPGVQPHRLPGGRCLAALRALTLCPRQACALTVATRSSAWLEWDLLPPALATCSSLQHTNEHVLGLGTESCHSGAQPSGSS